MQARRERGKRLQEHIDRLSKYVREKKARFAQKEKCFPTMIVAGVLTPIIIWLFLYFVQPRFVQNKEGTRHVRSNTKVFYWTVIVTVIVWATMYLWVWCNGYDKVSMLCAR